MPAYLVLTTAQKDAVVGASNTGHRIEPVLLPDTNWGCPAAVMAGTFHSDKRSLLLNKPVRTVTKPSGTIIIGSDYTGDAETWRAYELTGTRFDQMGCRIAEGSLTPASEIPNQPWGVSGAAVNGKVSLGTFLIDVRANGIAFNGWDFRGKWLLVRAHDVSFTDCLFDSQAWDAPTNSVNVIVRVLAHYLGGVSNNPLFDFCTFDGFKANVPATALWPDACVGTVVRRSLFKHWGDDPIVSHGGLYEDLYMKGTGYCYGQQASNGEYYDGIHGDLFWLRMSREPTTIRRCFFDMRNPDAIPQHWEGVTWSGGSFNQGTPSGGTKLSSLNTCVRTVTGIGSLAISHPVNVYNNVMIADPGEPTGYLVSNGNQGLGNNTGVYGADGPNWVQPATFTGVYYPNFLTSGTVFRDFRNLWTGASAAAELMIS